MEIKDCLFPLSESVARDLPPFYVSEEVTPFQKVSTTLPKKEADIVLGHLLHVWQHAGGWHGVGDTRIIVDLSLYQEEYSRQWREYDRRRIFWWITFGLVDVIPLKPTLPVIDCRMVKDGLDYLVQVRLLKAEEHQNGVIVFSPTIALITQLREWGYLMR